MLANMLSPYEPGGTQQQIFKMLNEREEMRKQLKIKAAERLSTTPLHKREEFCKFKK